MVIPGRVHQGVVVLEGNQSLPEGATVTVVYQDRPITTVDRKKRPYSISTGYPATVRERSI